MKRVFFSVAIKRGHVREFSRALSVKKKEAGTTVDVVVTKLFRYTSFRFILEGNAEKCDNFREWAQGFAITRTYIH